MGRAVDETDDSADERAAPGVPVVLGRYVVLQKLGMGGMGVVYAAYDPELDRKVALKLVRVTGDEVRARDARQRLLREAQMMARVDHPSVITVHDVGTHGDEVFVAMELVDGTTLRGWLAQARRSRREIVAMFLQAAEGLVAAHAVGLVLRDFKPDNVLVGRDGRVRVTDFGLARTALAPVDGATADGHSNHAGTPAYMAPEQHLGHAPDARSDQFSFCVALYEALYGERPFQAQGDLPNTMALALATLEGRVRPPAEGSGVPAWLRNLLLRGLEVDPAARFASMTELVAALSSDRTRRRRWALVAAAAGALAIVAGAAVVLRISSPEVCTGFEDKLVGVWDATLRARVEGAFDATGVPFAADTAKRVAEALDARTRQWLALRGDACRATRVRGDQSEQLLDQRVQCLDSRLGEMKALIGSFATATPAVVEKAIIAVGAMPDLDLCANALYVTQTFRPPRNDAERARVDALAAELGQANALEATGRYKEALEIARLLENNARALGYRPLEAEATLRLADLLATTGDMKAGERRLLDAAILAQGAGVDEVAARAWMRLAGVIGDELARPHDAEPYLRLAEAAVERFGSTPELAMRLGLARGNVLIKAARHADALREFEQVIALGRGLDPPLTQLEWKARVRVPDVLRSLGRSPESLPVAREGLAYAEAHFGARHTNTATTHFVLGNVLFELTRYGEAHREFAAAAAIRSYIGDHSWLIKITTNLGSCEVRMGDLTTAEAHFREALRIAEKVLGPDSVDVGEILTELAQLLVRRKSYEGALAAYARADAIGLAAKRKKIIALVNAGIGEIHALHGRWQDALAAYERAADAAGETSLRTIPAMIGRSLALAELGRADEAKALAARAKQAAARSGAADQLVAAQLVEAQLAWPEDRARARAAVAHARDELARLGDVRATIADAWLASHP